MYPSLPLLSLSPSALSCSILCASCVPLSHISTYISTCSALPMSLSTTHTELHFTHTLRPFSTFHLHTFALFPHFALSFLSLTHTPRLHFPHPWIFLPCFTITLQHTQLNFSLTCPVSPYHLLPLPHLAPDLPCPAPPSMKPHLLGWWPGNQERTGFSGVLLVQIRKSSWNK